MIDSNPVIAGVDLGGSVVRVGLFTTAGELLDFQATTLGLMRTADTGREQTIRLLEVVLQKNGYPRLLGIGIGATGPVDPAEGTMISPFTQPAWQYVPLAKPVSVHFGVPCVLENDADAAGLGEYWLGSGQLVNTLLAVTVGTGIGTALIQNGRIYRGMDGMHPEGGHHLVDPAGPQCYCGLRGCWESLASGEALSAAARELARQQPDWLAALATLGVTEISQINGAVVAQAARQQDARALELMRHEGYYLALGLLNMICVYVPDKIVLSGSVIKSFDLLEPELRRTLSGLDLMVPVSRVTICPSEMGYSAGVTGAAYALLLFLQSC